MPEKNEREILNSMLQKIEEIKSLLVLLNQEKLIAIKKELLKENSVKKQVYELCDGTKSPKEIAEVVKKDTSYVSSYLTILRREGLIRNGENNGNPEQNF